MKNELIGGRTIEIPIVDGDPNGSHDGNKGDLCIDGLGPALYQKTTDFGNLTGWERVGGVAGAQQYYEVDNGDPNGQVTPIQTNKPAQCHSIGTFTTYRWNIVSQQWV